jgi:hypothetical protein
MRPLNTLNLVRNVIQRAKWKTHKNGFKNPSGLLPAAISSSLSSAMMLANMGVLQLVPSTSSSAPSSTISTEWPCAEISGKARPLALNNPAFVSPRKSRYALTAASWYDGRGKMFENPPDENGAEVSGTPAVAPTEVTLKMLLARSKCAYSSD